MSKTKAAPAAEFDEHAPPPRRRPTGDPVPRHTELPPGEHPAAQFAHWDSHGRVPEGSVLAEFVGRPIVVRAGAADWRGSGYRVAGLDATGRTPLGPVGADISPEAIRAYAIAAWVVARPFGGLRFFVVLAPSN